jgi:hypothetical protein
VCLLPPEPLSLAAEGTQAGSFGIKTDDDPLPSFSVCYLVKSLAIEPPKLIMKRLFCRPVLICLSAVLPALADDAAAKADAKTMDGT